MRVLDMFSGGGGASMGIHRAGDVIITGVDIAMQRYYPFWFLRADALKLPADWLRGFDFIWASPPCQAYSYAGHRWRSAGAVYPDLVELVRKLLVSSGKPFVIENVAGAPIRKDLMLCGEMFGLKVIRHRYFEIHGFSCSQPDHQAHRGMVKDGYYVTVAGNGGDYKGHNFCTLNDLPGATQLETWQHAMGIDWIHRRKPMREAVPPAYAEYIFRQFLERGSLHRC